MKRYLVIVIISCYFTFEVNGALNSTLLSTLLTSTGPQGGLSFNESSPTSPSSRKGKFFFEYLFGLEQSDLIEEDSSSTNQVKSCDCGEYNEKFTYNMR